MSGRGPGGSAHLSRTCISLSPAPRLRRAMGPAAEGGWRVHQTGAAEEVNARFLGRFPAGGATWRGIFGPPPLGSGS
jgi:hypothetical protein